jgi:hypothetical protein
MVYAVGGGNAESGRLLSVSKIKLSRAKQVKKI